MWEKQLLTILVVSVVSYGIKALDLHDRVQPSEIVESDKVTKKFDITGNVPSDAIRVHHGDSVTAKDGVPSIVRSCKAFPLGSSAFLLRWEPPQHSNASLIGYKVSYREENDTDEHAREPQIQDPYATQTKLTGLKPNTRYRVFIGAYTGNGDGERCELRGQTKPPGMKKPDQPTFTFELLPLETDFLRVKVIWLPNVDGNPGTDFYVKYRLKGVTEWHHTNPILKDDFSVIECLSPKETYEMIVVSLEGHFEAESDIQKVTRALENPTHSLFIDRYVIIGATAVVLCLILGFSAFMLFTHKKGKCRRFRRPTKRTLHPGLEPNLSKLDVWYDDGFTRIGNNYEIQNRHERNLSSEQKLNSMYCLTKFEEGNIGGINPELTLDEQADLLPYDQKFEFPKEKLQLGHQLGMGAFGVVFKATAKGIVSYEEETTVAVKMLKSIASDEVLRALALELKILVHLGRHLNVVNLLGAITKNISQRELMLIVEYCPFGNLQNFLVKNRKHFVDQLNRNEDRIDAKITERTDKNVYVYCHSTPAERLTTTTDLLCWSFQIARGMHYLASRKVLHGDLAARNILLCDNNVVKICDFGLARSMYKTGVYHISSARALPFKWLALESISDQVFSTYSDVWSFGIVLWEIFSLGATPYPGMNAGTDLFQKLKEGYRLEKPEYASRDIYDIMLSCWQLIPKSRPLFDKLEEEITKMMDRSVSEHYIIMNEPYLEVNVNRFSSGQTDYFALLGSPDCQSPSKPKTSHQTLNFQTCTAQAYSKSRSPNTMEVSHSSDID
ncbi:vascular endothelial growth factor receptor 3-like [Sitodiplosis mosellana]|uniref:vascular endothelial growth factor receptor 3-like n=1 Tax=Sitodiplosis mosellana TaxID=263140 RepID=UPI0024443E95|nr:vascular endothelial growth factor receptor 3-like [Sitodiplosis mosellana]